MLVVKILQVLLRWLIYPASIIDGVIGTLSLGYVSVDLALMAATQYSRYTIKYDLVFLPAIRTRMG